MRGSGVALRPLHFFSFVSSILIEALKSTYRRLVVCNKDMKEQHGPTSARPTPAIEQKEAPRFGHYELVRRIDVGGMGEVYLARQQTAFGRLVAIKIIRSDLIHDRVARQRFLREAEVSAHLKHEHILPLFEFGEEQGRLFLVTPYIEGGTLARRLQRGPLSLAEIQQLFTALVSAVAYIHKRGVVHRDLKPSNILLDQAGEDEQIYVRLIDFGIATIQGVNAPPHLTTAGNEMGTAAYMAPERLDGVSAPSNDIYSLGIILYQMITGHLPTEGKLLSLPLPFQEVVKRCTAPDPLDRYASADELLKAFENACQQMKSGLHPHVPLAPEKPINDVSAHRVSVQPPAQAASPSVASAPAQDSLILRPVPPQAKKDGASAQHGFQPHDYSAQTAHISMEDLQRMSLNDEEGGVVAAPSPAPASIPLKHRPQRKRGSLLSLITIVMIVLLFVIAGSMYLAFESSITATITITPVVHPYSAALTMLAEPQLHGIDVAHSAIPASSATDSESGSQSGPTSEPSGCVISVFCQRVVTPDDANALASTLRTRLRNTITTKIQQQISAQHGTLIGNINFIDQNPQVNPSIGSPSDTVTVSLTEVGTAEYVVLSDAQRLARIEMQQQVQKQYGPNFVLLSAMTQVGQPTIKAVDASGNVTLTVPVAGVAEYQFPNSQLLTMQNHLRGMKISVARAYMQHQEGVDPGTLTVTVTSGDTIPNNTAQIRIVHLNPSNLPSVQLPTSTPATTH